MRSKCKFCDYLGEPEQVTAHLLVCRVRQVVELLRSTAGSTSYQDAKNRKDQKESRKPQITCDSCSFSGSADAVANHRKNLCEAGIKADADREAERLRIREAEKKRKEEERLRIREAERKHKQADSYTDASDVEKKDENNQKKKNVAGGSGSKSKLNKSKSKGKKKKH